MFFVPLANLFAELRFFIEYFLYNIIVILTNCKESCILIA